MIQFILIAVLALTLALFIAYTRHLKRDIEEDGYAAPTIRAMLRSWWRRLRPPRRPPYPHSPVANAIAKEMLERSRAMLILHRMGEIKPIPGTDGDVVRFRRPRPGVAPFEFKQFVRPEKSDG